MAIDLLIGSLLLLSVLVNVLALCAFRVTPSLQTRSNSFVVNLLVINVISCFILAAFLVLNVHSVRDLLSLAPTGQEPRYFLDVVATWGALGLTLVICDTHSAITDPLRYHSHLSTLRVWLMIAGVWALGALCGVASFFRGAHTPLFTALFGALVIVAPFCLICAMYWRIFREARQNGLRMRQNGSSPLLQSSLTLNASQSVNAPPSAFHQRALDAHRPTIETIMEKSPSYSEGLTLRIDGKGSASMEKLPIDSQPQFRSLANLSVSRNESLRQMFLFGVSADSQSAENDDEAEAEAEASRANELLNQLNSLQPKAPEVRQVRSTPDLQSYLNQEDGLRVAPSSRTGEKSSQDFPFRSGVPSQTPPKQLSYMTSIRHRLSNASSLFKYREESRAARISILVVIMFLVSYIPYLLLLVAADRSLLSHYAEVVLSIFVVLLANIGSPIIFAYRNKRVRRAVKRMLGRESQELLPSSFCSTGSRRIYRKKTVSAYKKNLVLRAGPGKRMRRLFLNCDAEKAPQQVQVRLPPMVTRTGYENYFHESLDAQVAEAHYAEKRNSTTSTASTIPCGGGVGGEAGAGKTVSLLGRFGFIRRESRKMQKFGVSV